jgi:hypothetical protein
MPTFFNRVFRKGPGGLQLSELVSWLGSRVLLHVMELLEPGIKEVVELAIFDTPVLEGFSGRVCDQRGDGPQVIWVQAPGNEWPDTIVRVRWIRSPLVP